MSNIDERLKEIPIESGITNNRGEYLTISRHLSGHEIEQIKAAFQEAGWFTPADKELVQEIMNHRAQQKIDEHRYVVPDTIPLNPRYTDEQLKAISEALSKPRMTGSEWLARFEKELNSGLAIPEPMHLWVIACAKAAAGLEGE